MGPTPLIETQTCSFTGSMNHETIDNCFVFFLVQFFCNLGCDIGTRGFYLGLIYVTATVVPLLSRRRSY